MTNVESFAAMLLALSFLIIGLFVALRLLLGKDIWDEVVGAFVYDVLKWLFLFPFKILRGLFGLIFRRR